MKRTRPEFNGDISYITSNTIAAADVSSQKSNEAVLTKM